MLVIDLDPLCCRITQLDGALIIEQPPALLYGHPPVFGSRAAVQRFLRIPSLVASVPEIDDHVPWTTAETEWIRSFLAAVPHGVAACVIHGGVHRGAFLAGVKEEMDRLGIPWVGFVRPGAFWCLHQEVSMGRHLVVGAGHNHGWAEVVEVGDRGIRTLSSSRLSHLGRQPFDDALMRRLRREYLHRFRLDPLATPGSAALLLKSLDEASAARHGDLALTWNGHDVQVEADELHRLLAPLWLAAGKDVEESCIEARDVKSVLLAPSVLTLPRAINVPDFGATLPRITVCKHETVKGVQPAMLQAIAQKDLGALIQRNANLPTPVGRKLAYAVILGAGCVAAVVLANLGPAHQEPASSLAAPVTRQPGLYVRRAIPIAETIRASDLEAVRPNAGDSPRDRPTEVWHVELGVAARPLDPMRALCWDDISAAAPTSPSTPRDPSSAKPQEGNGR